MRSSTRPSSTLLLWPPQQQRTHATFLSVMTRLPLSPGVSKRHFAHIRAAAAANTLQVQGLLATCSSLQLTHLHGSPHEALGQVWVGLSRPHSRCPTRLHMLLVLQAPAVVRLRRQGMCACACICGQAGAGPPHTEEARPGARSKAAASQMGYQHPVAELGVRGKGLTTAAITRQVALRARVGPGSKCRWGWWAIPGERGCC